MTDRREMLLAALVETALTTNEVLPSQISEPALQPPPSRPALAWRAGRALHHMVTAGVGSDDLQALVQQVRVRAIADALGVLESPPDWSVCTMSDKGHAPQGGLDGELWFLANQVER